MPQAFSHFPDLEHAGGPLPDQEHERWTRQQLMHYQARALHLCRAYAYAHSPFYQRFHQHVLDRPLHKLPVLTKSMLMEHFDEIMTDRAICLRDIRQYMADPRRTALFLERYRVMTTSGSSGAPALFLYNQSEWATVMASLGRLISWLDPAAWSKPALLAASGPWYMTAHIQQSMAAQGESGWHFSASDPVATTVQRLNDAQPTALLGYPSAMRVLASEQARGRLHIAPRAVVCSSEQLTGETRHVIEKAWQIQPHNLYATTEGGLLAAECSHHQGLHMFEDLVIVEVVDHNYQPVPPGTPGDRVLLTVLFGRTMPLLRYELTDSVRLSTHHGCACGRPFALLDDLRGRLWDMLHLLSPTGADVPVHVLVFEKAIDLFPVSGWQVIQTQEGVRVLVSGAQAEQIDAPLLAALKKALEELGVALPPLSIEHVPAIVRGSSGKVTLISSQVSHPTL